MTTVGAAQGLTVGAARNHYLTDPVVTGERYSGLRALTITPVATWSWRSAGMVSRMTWMTSGVNSGYRAAWSIPNGRCPPTQTSANPARCSLPAKTRSAIAPDTHPAQAL